MANLLDGVGDFFEGAVNAVTGGGGDNGAVGFNADNIVVVEGKVDEVVVKVRDDIVTNLENDLVTPMAGAWFAPEAVSFFSNFNKYLTTLEADILAAFQSYKDSLERTKLYWIEQTKRYDNASDQGYSSSTEGMDFGASLEGVTAEKINPDSFHLQLDVSSVKEENDNKDVVIYSNKATQIANDLKSIHDKIKYEIGKEKEDLEIKAALIGGDQAEKVQEMFGKVLDAVAEIFAFLHTGGKDEDGNEVGSLADQINAAVKKYGDVAGEVSKAYSEPSSDGDATA